MMYMQRMRPLELFSLEKAQEDLVNVYKYLIGGSKEDEDTSVAFSVVPHENIILDIVHSQDSFQKEYDDTTRKACSILSSHRGKACFYWDKHQQNIEKDGCQRGFCSYTFLKEGQTENEEKVPNIQSKPPLVQLEAISSCPNTCYLGEETDPHLSTTSFQAKQPQLPQPLLIRLLLQTLHQLRCPSLDTLQPLNVSLVVGGPKLNTGFEVRPHQCRVQGHDHFPSPAGHAIFDTSQDAIGFLGHLSTLLAHIQAAVNQHPQVHHLLPRYHLDCNDRDRSSHAVNESSDTEMQLQSSQVTQCVTYTSGANKRGCDGFIHPNLKQLLKCRGCTCKQHTIKQHNKYLPHRLSLPESLMEHDGLSHWIWDNQRIPQSPSITPYLNILLNKALQLGLRIAETMRVLSRGGKP
ncbi:hypothetical protein QYF61_026086 [Mycteria americana]|uniref:Uncharacterized protein n=1 Tax=Mycteria americana TaxID=33587 RepID=A0AAN7S158_MYCAM|nr:hypothetical protein QYF61_026086 [Mycteria americana]